MSGLASFIVVVVAATSVAGCSLIDLCYLNPSSCDAGTSACGTSVPVDQDPLNCGRCGHDCAGGSCSNGQCQPFVLASQEGGPKGIALAGTVLFWADYDGNRIRRLALTDNSPPTTFASGLQGPTGLAVDLESVTLYWTEANGGLIQREKYNGGAIQPVETAVDFAEGVATDGTTLYWTSTHIHTVNQTVINDFTPQLITSAATSPIGVVANNGELYWVDLDAATITKATLQGDGGVGSPSVFVSTGTGSEPWYITLDATYVYWSERGNQRIMRRVRDASAAPEVLATNQTLPAGVAVDASFVYWANRGDGTIMRLAL